MAVEKGAGFAPRKPKLKQWRRMVSPPTGDNCQRSVEVRHEMGPPEATVHTSREECWRLEPARNTDRDGTNVGETMILREIQNCTKTRDFTGLFSREFTEACIRKMEQPLREDLLPIINKSVRKCSSSWYSGETCDILEGDLYGFTPL